MSLHALFAIHPLGVFEGLGESGSGCGEIAAACRQQALEEPGAAGLGFMLKQCCSGSLGWFEFALRGQGFDATEGGHGTAGFRGQRAIEGRLRFRGVLFQQ